MELGDRMKGYESVPKLKLMRRTPVILRLDGKSFHTYTRGFSKPWDSRMLLAMTNTATFVCDHIAGAKLAYVQSDEISILITDYEKLDTQPWFDYQVQKLVSVSASLATYEFNAAMYNYFGIEKPAFFDSRVANYPKEEVANYFVWRQKDAERNSIQGLAQSLFPRKELQGISNKSLQDKMLTEKDINWNDCKTWQKRGVCVVKQYGNEDRDALHSWWITDMDIPIFTADREYIERFI